MPNVTFTVGGQKVAVEPMPFLCLEAAWPHIGKLGAAKNNVEGTRAAIGIFCAATLLQADPQDEGDVARRLQGTEYDDFNRAIMELMKVSGLEFGGTGEAKAADGSTGTGAASSPSSLPAA